MPSGELNTNTSQWSLVIHRVSQTTAEVWVGTLFPFMKMPDHARVVLSVAGVRHRERRITRADWQRPFSTMNQRFYCLAVFTGLEPGTIYGVSFDRRIEALPGVFEQAQWQGLREGELTTLPATLPGAGEKPFTVALGSCFYNHRDGGQAAASFKALYERGGDCRPDITFLSGDQVYLDIGFDSLSLIPEEIHQRIASDYALHWQALGSILNRGGTWMLPDDHEYWNDFPFLSPIPVLASLVLPSVRNAWTAASRDAVTHIQRTPKVDVFSIGDDLSFCVADVRSWRSDQGFMDETAFRQLCHWAETLASPGVLVLSQPLIVSRGKVEKNLLNFASQYQRLLAALGSSGHDVVLLSGDVHFGRISRVPLGKHGGHLTEIISSPLSNLTGLNGIATSKAEFSPKQFPQASIARALGWPRVPVDYVDQRYGVSSKRGILGSAYPKRRTREHFMTIGFRKTASGSVQLSAQAWRVRERAGSKNLPVKDFARAFTTLLR